jgi:hypothetical protein
MEDAMRESTQRRVERAMIRKAQQKERLRIEQQIRRLVASQRVPPERRTT